MAGGTGGAPFNDTIPPSTQLAAVQLRSGDKLDQISLQYNNGNAATTTEGGSGGAPYVFYLGKDECIIAVQIWAGSEVDAVQFKTNKGRSSLKYGGNGGTLFSFFAPPKSALSGIKGRSGHRVDNLEPIWGPTTMDTSTGVHTIASAPAGGNGGGSFSDYAQLSDPRASMIQSITVRHGSRVDAIQVTYVPDQQCPTHGGSGGGVSVFTLNNGEYISCIEGRSGSRIDQLRFITNTGRYSPYYGGNGGGPFRWLAPDGYGLLYFTGRSGSGLDQLTANWTPNPPLSYDIINVAYAKPQSSPSQAFGANSDVYYRNDTAQVGHYTQSVNWEAKESTTFTLSQSTTNRIGYSKKFSIQIPVIEGLSASSETEVSASRETTVQTTNGETKETTFTIVQGIDIPVSPHSVLKGKLFYYSMRVKDLAWAGTLRITYPDGKTQDFPASGTVSGNLIQNAVNIDVKETPI